LRGPQHRPPAKRTLDARFRTGRSISTQIKQGRFRVMEQDGRDFTPLSGWLDQGAAVDFIDAL
jgi:hypothetical protein